MPEDKPQPVTPPPVPPKPKPEPVTDYAHVSMGEEFSKAKWRLPPVGVVVIALLIVAVAVGVVSWTTRAKPGASGSIDDVGAVATDPNNVMVALQVTLTNVGSKPFWVKNVTGKLQTGSGEYPDTAASVADFDRYFQAFPELKQHATAEPLRPELKIPPGATVHGSIIFSFPVSKDAFDQRKSLSVTVQPYDQPRAVVITK